MKISNDILKISTVPFDIKGNKIEPEAQTAKRILSTHAPVDLGLKDGKHIGDIPSEVEYRTTAGEFARNVRNPCFACAHFNNGRFLRMLAHSETPLAPPDEKILKRELVEKIVGSKNAVIDPQSEKDIEKVLKSLGICEALSSTKEPIFVFPEGGCPDDVRGPFQPQGFFKPKSREHERQGAKIYDKVLRLAQGNK